MLPASSLVPFAECPRCGGWARREALRGRGRCRGCNWSGVLPAGAAAGEP